jgi:hypothetical protein
VAQRWSIQRLDNSAHFRLQRVFGDVFRKHETQSRNDAANARLQAP